MVQGRNIALMQCFSLLKSASLQYKAEFWLLQKANLKFNREEDELNNGRG